MNFKEESRKKILWVLYAINGARQLQDYGLACVVEVDFLELTEKDPEAPSLSDIRNILHTQLEKRLGIVEVVEKYTGDWNSATHFLLEVNREKLGCTYAWLKSENTFECGLLRINLDGGTIQYGSNDPVLVSPKANIVKFLTLLIGYDGKIVDYAKIAKDLGLSCWHEMVKEDDKNIHREVQQLKKDVREFLINKVKMLPGEVDKMITAVEKAGFKINY